MDAVINGEVSEEPAEKEKREENLVSDADSEVVSCNSKIESECQENSSPHNSPLPKTITLNSDESLPQNIKDGDLNVPQNKSSDDGTCESKKKETEQLPTPRDSVQELSDIKSPEKDCDGELSVADKEIEESLVCDKQEPKEGKDPISTPEAMDENEIVSETKSADKVLCEKSASSDKVGENMCESSTISINPKSDSCHELVDISEDSQKEDDTNKIVSCDLANNSLPNENPDNHLSEICINSVNHASHQPPSAVKNSNQVSSEDSNLHLSAANINHKEQSNLSPSESKLPNSDSVTVGVLSNNSNPLAQLNQHIKSISSEENKIDNISPKTDQNFNANKVESSKVCQKDNSDRHKEKESNCFVFTEISKEDI